MPIYEYRCESCGHELEKMQKISDAPLTECPACGASALKKLISAAGFRLKGSGWYETDFKKAGKKNLHEGGDKGEKGEKGESKEGKKSESKTEGGKAADSGSKPAETKPAAKKDPA